MNSSERTPAQTRVDAFHDGRFVLVQPVGGGYRAGLDALLLAACVPTGALGEAVDLGAGTGAVGFAAVSRAANLTMTMVEREPVVAGFLHASIGLAENRPLAHRLSCVTVDLLAPKSEREAAGLADGRFALALTNPPFHPAGHRVSPDPVRAAALSVEGPDFLLRWFRRAAALLARRGRLAAIVRPADLPTIAEALAGRLGGLAVLPVYTRPGEATRILVGAVQGSRQAMRIFPGLTLFDESGPANAVLRAIAAGRHSIELFDGIG